jgi:SAM-dependent methyltransferase
LRTEREGEPAPDAGFEETWRARFEQFAQWREDDAGIAGWSRTGLDARVRRFLGLWTPGAAGRRWLDVGCGAGTYTRILHERGYEAVGVDYSLPTLRKAALRNSAGTFALADVRRLPFRADQFDGVLCFGVTQALAESGAAVRELAAQVRPGGELWIDALNTWCVVHAFELLRRRLHRRSEHLRYESPRQLERALRECGFIDIRLHWLPIVPPRARILQRLIESRPADWSLRIVPFLGLLLSHAFIVRGRKPERGA